jgi:formylglycine-generating enzyme required for sulfatase activity
MYANDLRSQGMPAALSNSIGMDLIMIKPGSYMRGSRKSPMEVAEQYGGIRDLLELEHPRHEVRITRPFYIGKFPLTVGQFRTFTEDKPRMRKRLERGGWVWHEGVWSKRRDANWQNPYFPQDDTHPVVCLSWYDAWLFCEWLSRNENRRYGLPTEAQWEYVCRAGSLGEFCSGDSLELLDDYAWHWKNSEARTHSVGLKKPNAWGIHDMHGHVLEWCRDWAGPYPGGILADPSGPEKGSYKICRGGSWLVYPHNLRSADRCRLLPSVRHADLGLRVALEWPA